MGMVKEFREFAMRGNVMDMAVGVIIGGAFGKIVSSLVADILTPIISVFTGGVNLAGESIPLKTVGGETLDLKWGNFAQTTFDFLIIALCIFLMIKAMNTAKARFEKQEEAAPKEPSAEVKLLTEIRDSLNR